MQSPTQQRPSDECAQQARLLTMEQQMQEMERTLTDIEQHMMRIRDTLTPEHMEFLVQSVEERRLKIEFWRAVRMKVATAGIWGTILLVCSVAVFAFESWIKRLAGG